MHMMAAFDFWSTAGWKTSRWSEIKTFLSVICNALLLSALWNVLIDRRKMFIKFLNSSVNIANALLYISNVSLQN